MKSGKSLNLKTTKEKITFLMMNYEKENVMDPEEKEIDKDSAVVSLIDGEEIPEEKNLSQKSFNLDKSQSLIGEEEMRREKRKKKYRKEEHYLKKVWLSKTNSPCHSQQSSLNFSTDSMSISRNTNTKPLLIKTDAKNSVFKSPFKKPDIKGNNYVFNSLRNSAKSDLSSHGSFADSFSSNFYRGAKINKEMTTNEIIKIKKESFSNSNDMPGLRKRVCRKVYSILNKEFKKPKTLSKKLTLAIEYRINRYFPYKKESYIKTVKSLFKKLRVN